MVIRAVVVRIAVEQNRLLALSAPDRITARGELDVHGIRHIDIAVALLPTPFMVADVAVHIVSARLDDGNARAQAG